MKLKYEQSKDTQELTEAEFDRKRAIVTRVLVKAKMNGVLTINEVEKEIGRNEKRVRAYF